MDKRGYWSWFEAMEGPGQNAQDPPPCQCTSHSPPYPLASFPYFQALPLPIFTIGSKLLWAAKAEVRTILIFFCLKNIKMLPLSDLHGVSCMRSKAGLLAAGFREIVTYKAWPFPSWPDENWQPTTSDGCLLWGQCGWSQLPCLRVPSALKLPYKKAEWLSEATDDAWVTEKLSQATYGKP